MSEVVNPTLTGHNGVMDNYSVTNPPELGMFTDEGNLALAIALLDALRVPAHEFPTDMETWWFEEWVAKHPVHSVRLAVHSEWSDTDVRDSIGWVLENPKRGVKFLTR